MRYLLQALALLLCAAPLLAHEPPTPASEREAWNQPVPEWWEGPVRYALTDEETREYRSLASRAGRAAFIERFWISRDPNPYDAGNEAEDVFWQRVSAADELFGQTTITGWRTDQGRVYIVLGPPDEITNYPVPSVDELDPTHFPDPYHGGSAGNLRPGHRGAVEWTYRSLRNPRAEAGQKVTFTRDETGEYRLSGQLASTFRFELSLGGPSMQAGDPTSSRRGRPYPGEAGPIGKSSEGPLGEHASRYEGGMRSVEDLFAFGQMALFEKAEPSRDLAGRVTTAQFFGVVLLQKRMDFFQGKGGTSTLITLGVPVADLGEGDENSPPVEVFGRLENVEDPSHVYQFSTMRKKGEEAPIQEVGGRSHRLYEVRGVIPPGQYKVNYGVRIGERIGAVGDRVQVPDFETGKLQISGPVLSEKIGEGSSKGGSAGFVLGRMRMLPKLEPVFRPESEFGFYFQVYQAGADPRDGRLHLDIEYSLSSREKGRFHPLGKPVSLSDNSAPAHAFLFPLKGWSRGEYLLTVTVADRVTGEVRAGSAPFLVQ